MPSECFSLISNYGGGSKQVKNDDLLSFCKGLQDKAPLQCVEAVKNTTLMPVAKALSSCENAIGAGSTSDFFLNDAVSICIDEMKPFLNPSFGLTADAILDFCVATDPKVYFMDGKGASTDIASSLTLTESSDCFQAAAELKTSSGSGGSLSETGPPLFNGKQRLELCENAPIGLGPHQLYPGSALPKCTDGSLGSPEGP